MLANIKKIIKVLNKNEYSTEKEVIKPYCVDWRGDYKGTSSLIVHPSTVEKISKIVKICNFTRTPIIPQGGNTGLVGGSVPRRNKGEIILNLGKLDKIRKINLTDKTITLESGCILENVKKELSKFNMVFPLSLGSKGSCQIGGNIATNAGGVNVIKYGSLRSNILGLEVVSSDGKVFSELNDIKKNNTGLDLKQLFIGSEGILGIITAATIRIFDKPQERIVLWVGIKNFKETLKLYERITAMFQDQITSFELMNKKSISIIKQNEFNFKIANNKIFCLIEISNFQKIDDFGDFVINKLSVLDTEKMEIIVSKSEYENQVIWNLRESIPVEERKIDSIIKHDVSIPLENMENFIKTTELEIKQFDRMSEIINFGHLGDNNLHYNVVINNPQKIKSSSTPKIINNIIFNNVMKNKGSISAEHGIGQLRKKELFEFKGKASIKAMKSIKKIFDPRNIFNPGKVI